MMAPIFDPNLQLEQMARNITRITQERDDMKAERDFWKHIAYLALGNLFALVLVVGTALAVWGVP